MTTKQLYEQRKRLRAENTRLMDFDVNVSEQQRLERIEQQLRHINTSLDRIVDVLEIWVESQK